MSKLRIYQLAVELNRDNAEIIRELQHMGVPVTSHSNTVEDRLADRLRRELGVYSPDAGRKAAGSDTTIEVDEPVGVEPVEAVEAVEPVVEAVPAEPEIPKVEVAAEVKVEPKVEERPPAAVEAKEPKVAAPPPVPPPPPAP